MLNRYDNNDLYKYQNGGKRIVNNYVEIFLLIVSFVSVITSLITIILMKKKVKRPEENAHSFAEADRKIEKYLRSRNISNYNTVEELAKDLGYIINTNSEMKFNKEFEVEKEKKEIVLRPEYSRKLQDIYTAKAIASLIDEKKSTDKIARDEISTVKFVGFKDKEAQKNELYAAALLLSKVDVDKHRDSMKELSWEEKNKYIHKLSKETGLSLNMLNDRLLVYAEK